MVNPLGEESSIEEARILRGLLSSRRWTSMLPFSWQRNARERNRE